LTRRSAGSNAAAHRAEALRTIRTDAGAAAGASGGVAGAAPLAAVAAASTAPHIIIHLGMFTLSLLALPGRAAGVRLDNPSIVR
jgi:hypothetical protein